MHSLSLISRLFAFNTIVLYREPSYLQKVICKYFLSVEKKKRSKATEIFFSPDKVKVYKQTTNLDEDFLLMHQRVILYFLKGSSL
jgi:hypothetical protein